jgi:hypothetical protein
MHTAGLLNEAASESIHVITDHVMQYILTSLSEERAALPGQFGNPLRPAHHV